MRNLIIAFGFLLTALPAASRFGPTEERALARLTAKAEAGKLVIHDQPTTWMEPKTCLAHLTGQDTIRVFVVNRGGAGGRLLEVMRPRKGAKPAAVSDTSWKMRPGGKESRAAVLGKPLSGLWAHFATPEARKALGSIRGFWIWRR